MTDIDKEAIRARLFAAKGGYPDFSREASAHIAVLLDALDEAQAEIERMKQACADADRAADEQIDGLQEDVERLTAQLNKAKELLPDLRGMATQFRASAGDWLADKLGHEEIVEELARVLGVDE